MTKNRPTGRYPGWQGAYILFLYKYPPSSHRVQTGGIFCRAAYLHAEMCRLTVTL